MARKAPKWQREGYATRRRYEDARARAVGFPDYATFQRLRNNPSYRASLLAFSRVNGKDPKQERRLDSNFNRRIAELGAEVPSPPRVRGIRVGRRSDAQLGAEEMERLLRVPTEGRGELGVFDWDAFFDELSPVGPGKKTRVERREARELRRAELRAQGLA